MSEQHATTDAALARVTAARERATPYRPVLDDEDMRDTRAALDVVAAAVRVSAARRAVNEFYADAGDDDDDAELAVNRELADADDALDAAIAAWGGGE